MSADQEAAEAPLRVAVDRPSPDAAVVRPVGDVDSASAGELRAAAEQAVDGGARDIVLDLAGVAFMGSAGLALLVEQRDAAAARGARLALAAVPRAVFRPLSLTGLLDVFEVHEDVDAALAVG